MMKRGAYIIILYLILLLCEKEICAPNDEDVIVDNSIPHIDDAATKCDADDGCKRKLSAVNSDLGKLKEGIEVMGQLGGLLSGVVQSKLIGAFASEIVDIAGKFGKLIPVIGPLLSLVAAFFPSGESQLIVELRQTVQRGFTRVNEELENIYNRLDRVEIICKSEAFKTRINGDKRLITDGRVRVRNWLERSKTNETSIGYRGAVAALKGREINAAAEHLLETIVNGDFADAIVDAENSNRSSIHGKLKQMFTLIYAGADTYIVWLKVMGMQGDVDFNDGFIESESTRWKTKFVEVGEAIIKFDNDHFLDDWEENFKTDIEEIAGKGGTSEVLAESIFSFLEGKYDWQHTFVIVYESTGTWSADLYWERCENRTVGISNHGDTGKSFIAGRRDLSHSFDTADARTKLDMLKTGYSTTVRLHTDYHRYATAEEVYVTSRPNDGSLCTDFLIKGVKTCNIVFHIYSAKGKVMILDKDYHDWDVFML